MFTLDEARAVLATKPEFGIYERDFGWVIDYNVSLFDTFVGATDRDTLILQNLRGTCFNHAGKIIRLPYHKFHNLNENPVYAAATTAIQNAMRPVMYTNPMNTTHTSMTAMAIRPIALAIVFNI